MVLHKNIAKSFGFMDFLNSRIYEYFKPIPSKSKHRAEWAREQLTLSHCWHRDQDGRPCHSIPARAVFFTSADIRPTTVTMVSSCQAWQFTEPLTQAGLELQQRWKAEGSIDAEWAWKIAWLRPHCCGGMCPLSQQVHHRGWWMITAFHSSVASRAATTLSFHG